LVTDVYAAREPVQPEFDIAGLAARIRNEDSRHISGHADTAQYLLDHVARGDVVIVLSAGDGERISDQLLANLRNRRHDHVRSETTHL
jgi:UDP-N-acetylmuramate-alanine ligase